MKSLVSSIKKIMKRNRLIFFTRYRLFDKDYRQNLRLMKTESIKSKEVISQEMEEVKKYWNCPPYHYVRYKLFAKELDKESLLDYIPSYFYYNFCYANYTRNLDILFYSNKLNQYHLFKKRGVPTPEIIAVCRGGKLYDIENIEINENHFFERYQRNLFFKPVTGRGGNGIYVFKKQGGNYTCQGKTVKSSDLSQLIGNNTYIVQEAVVQSQEINNINPTTLNTLRVITHYSNDRVSICCTILRIGRGDKDVDNSAQGGLSINVDVITGKFADYAVTEHNMEEFYIHPETGYEFRGNGISGWEEIKAGIVNVASKFSELVYVGWDFALASEGLEVIEMNLGFGLDHLQISSGGMRRKMNIYPE